MDLYDLFSIVMDLYDLFSFLQGIRVINMQTVDSFCDRTSKGEL